MNNGIPYINILNKNGSSSKPIIVSELPEPSKDTQGKTYMISSQYGDDANAYDEYITINAGTDANPTYAWEKMGGTTIDLNGYYQKPQTGIPLTDLTSGVQTSLGKADSAVQKLVVEISYTNNTYSADKTFAEITAAYSSDKLVEAHYGNNIYRLSSISNLAAVFEYTESENVIMESFIINNDSGSTVETYEASISDGTTPHIDPTTKHWMIGETDTQIKAEGQDGEQGTSAFDIWLENGHTGNITDFLAWMKDTSSMIGPKYAATVNDCAIVNNTPTLYYVPNGSTFDVYLADEANVAAKQLATGVPGDITNYTSIYDVSEDNAINGVPAQYSTLSAAIDDIAPSAQKGGMTIEYIDQASGKYVQYRYLLSSTAAADFINTNNWEETGASSELKGRLNMLEGYFSGNTIVNEETDLTSNLETGYIATRVGTQVNFTPATSPAGYKCYSIQSLANVPIGTKYTASGRNGNTGKLIAKIRNGVVIEAHDTGTTITEPETASVVVDGSFDALVFNFHTLIPYSLKVEVAREVQGTPLLERLSQVEETAEQAIETAEQVEKITEEIDDLKDDVFVYDTISGLDITITNSEGIDNEGNIQTTYPWSRYNLYELIVTDDIWAISIENIGYGSSTTIISNVAFYDSEDNPIYLSGAINTLPKTELVGVHKIAVCSYNATPVITGYNKTAVSDAVKELKEQIQEQIFDRVSYLPIDNTHGRWNGINVGDTVSQSSSGSQLRILKHEVALGEIYLVYGKGGATATRLWAVLDSSDIILSVAEANAIYTKDNPYPLIIDNPDAKYIVATFLDYQTNEYGAALVDSSTLTGEVLKNYYDLNSKIEKLNTTVTKISNQTLNNIKCILLDGASFAVTGNRWFSMLCSRLNVSGINKAVGGTYIWNMADKMSKGTLYTQQELEEFDILMIMHVRNKDVFTPIDGHSLEDDYTNYDVDNIVSSEDAAQAFDYVLKKYAADCYALKDVPTSKWYEYPMGKPFVVVVLTHWHDGRPIYNDSVRQLRDKWGFYLVELDKNIGFSGIIKNPADTTTYISRLYATSLAPTGDGVGGWHPLTSGKGSDVIQKKIADIVFNKVKEIPGII